MTPIFKQLSDMLKHDEKIQFTVSKQGSQLAVLIQPVLKGKADGLSDAAGQLRAALAMPLYVTADSDTLDADFAGCLLQYQTTRNSVQNSLNAAMSRVKESAKEAQADNAAPPPLPNTLSNSDTGDSVTAGDNAIPATATNKSLF